MTDQARAGRRTVVDMTEDPPAIKRLADPSPDEQESAIIVAVFQARAMLSEAERIADMSESGFARGIQLCRDGSDCLGAARAMLADELSASRVRDLLDRACHAADTAIEHAQLAHTYASSSDHTDFDDRMTRNVRRHWYRATQLARQDAHRALSDLAELFPEAYRKTAE